MFQLTRPGDPIHAAQRWPESRPWIEAGQFLLDRLYPKVYAESHLRRIQEKKPEPLPLDMRQ